MNKFRIKNINIGKLLVAVGLGTTLSMCGTKCCKKMGPYIDSETGKLGLYYVNTKNIHLSNEELLDEFNKVFYSSDKLQKEWKDVYPIISDFILKYGDKLDQEELLDTLSTLDFEYIDGLRVRLPYVGMYDFEGNIIHYDDIIEYKDEDEASEIRIHEAFHYLFHQHFFEDPTNVLRLGLQLDEGIVTELTSEYGFESDECIYYKNKIYLKALCELIGKDKYLECLGNHSIMDLINSLSQYGNYIDSISLIYNIDKACGYYDTMNTDYDKKAWNIINKLYKNKNEVSIEDSKDVVMKTYSNSLTDSNYFILETTNPSSVEIKKNYFVYTEDLGVKFEDENGKNGFVRLNQDNTIVDEISNKEKKLTMVK